jgi:hypothetical protein
MLSSQTVYVLKPLHLGITPIYLSLIDIHVVVNMLRSGRGSFSSRLEIPD